MYFSSRFHAPSAAIAFGAANASLPLMGNTLATGIKALLMTLALSIGLAVPTLVFFDQDSLE
ncbi:hypothetical protein PCC7424_2958 [Gloeothece citriformis PCC 7424]|uniref:Uncharacterized protein n=1 Tax=Gloeothece citriformis (strain PCC 7424) TaxID=65393 RepID=B7KA05_GLOC7|nr:hypothetical protein [Gloeothece citriformis]ACK71361.1 hypothetical protein PCC7424_2958 [Gloeothece citriformis PCC 7424]